MQGNNRSVKHMLFVTGCNLSCLDGYNSRVVSLVPVGSILCSGAATPARKYEIAAVPVVLHMK